MKLNADRPTITEAIGVFFVLLLSSYFPFDKELFHLISISCIFFLLFPLLQGENGKIVNLYAFMLAVSLYVLTLKYKVMIVPANFTLYVLMQISFKAHSFPLLPFALSVAPLLLLIELFAYWGLPGSSFLVWFWGIPTVVFLFLILTLLKGRFLVVVLCFALAVVFHQIALYQLLRTEIQAVTQKEDMTHLEGVNNNALYNLGEPYFKLTSQEAVEVIKSGGKKGKWFIIGPATPDINYSLIETRARMGEYFIFGEHDNMLNFRGNTSYFNDDSFQRNELWHLYSPMMPWYLQYSLSKDQFYCSNIGCTLSLSALHYPLVWSYAEGGKPIFLAGGIFHGLSRLTLIGDSDPVGDFLVCFNPNWLRTLFGYPIIEILIIGVLLVFSVISLTLKRKLIGYSITLGLLTLILVIPRVFQSFPRSSIGRADISFSSTTPWLSPHLESSFSSLPKNSYTKGSKVAVETLSCEAHLHISIVTTSTKLESVINPFAGCNLILLLPNGRITTKNGQTIEINDIPLGNRSVEVLNKRLKIFDARILKVNGKESGKILLMRGGVWIIGTNSPQLTEGINELLKK